MQLNRIQRKIFDKLSEERDLDIDDYIQQYSLQFIDRQRHTLEEISEEEADKWIHTAYVLSLE